MKLSQAISDLFNLDLDSAICRFEKGRWGKTRLTRDAGGRTAFRAIMYTPSDVDEPASDLTTSQGMTLDVYAPDLAFTFQ
jgi:hypothetical protein